MTVAGYDPEKNPSQRHLEVLIGVGEGSSTENPYIALLVGSLPSDIHVRYFSWMRALFGRYDVLHLHWPEALVSARTAPRRIAKSMLSLALAARVLVARTRVVRTVHNIDPHEPPTLTVSLAMHLWDRLTDQWIVLNPRTTLRPGVDAVVIPHGDYRPWFGDIAPVHRIPASGVLYFGLIRRYKGVAELVEMLEHTPDMPSEMSITVAGRPDDASVAAALRRVAEERPQLRLDLRYVPDATLRKYIEDCDLVMLPYTDVGNSGAALLALSMNRPILIPDHVLTRDLLAEFGPDYVMLYQPPLTLNHLLGALRHLESKASLSPADMSGRDWKSCAKAHARIYRGDPL